MCILHNTHTYIVTIVLGGLCGVSAKWSYVTASPNHHDKAIPILSPLLFMHVGHPYIPLFKIRRIFFLLVHVTIVLGDLCDKIGLVGVSAKWSYVTASPSHHDQAIPILSPLYVGHPYIPLLRVFDLLVSPPFLVSFRQVATRIYTYIIFIILTHFPPSPPLFPHCSITMRFVTKKVLIWLVSSMYI